VSPAAPRRLDNQPAHLWLREITRDVAMPRNGREKRQARDVAQPHIASDKVTHIGAENTRKAERHPVSRTERRQMECTAWRLLEFWPAQACGWLCSVATAGGDGEIEVNAEIIR
jgi:hypothetical protein